MDFKERLPAYTHLLKIRDKLWASEGNSKVTIMVGAGFSRNAAKIEESFEGMAVWNDLKSILLGDLINHSNINNKSVLEIGELYVEEYGRSALDEVLKKSIPDENYEPSKLYDKLLNLPWADIYTTNYDTLLERAKSNIYERNYQVIYDVSDIPTSIQPRIIKLHGSFPANRPFIFTRKDYDNYPELFSPFVNMVQQSIMETTFVLIGFSGDDPNFEKWTSWVRNNLKEHMPKIYMIGMDEGRREESLDKKGITLIDFKEVYADSRNYNEMFNELFDFLAYKERHKKSDWPFSTKHLIKNLKSIRDSYPGWVILPNEIRRNHAESIHTQISEYVKRFDSNSNSGIKDNELVITKEIIAHLIDIIWIMDKFHIPMFRSLEVLLQKVTSNKEVTKSQVNKINLRLLKEARLDCLGFYFFERISLLENETLDSNDNHQLQYELIKYYLDVNNISKATTSMEKWHVGNREPEWGVKKACLYKKIKEDEKSEILFEKYLQTIRKLLSIKMDDYRLLSLESIILNHFNDDDGNQYAFERLKILNTKQCDAMFEFSSTLRSIQNYVEEEFKTIKRNFDPDLETISYNFTSRMEYELLESYAVVDMDEQFYFSEKLFSKKDKEKYVLALQNIKYLYELHSLKKIILRDDKTLIFELLTREYVIYIDHKVKEILLQLLEPSIRFDDKKSIISNRNALEVYSRLFMTLSSNERKEINPKIIESIEKLYDTKDNEILKEMDKYLVRFCRPLYDEELKKFIEQLIIIDVSNNLPSVESYSFFEPIYVLFDRYYTKVKGLKIPDRNINIFFDILENDISDSRKEVALIRISFLLLTNSLSMKNRKRFTEIVASLPRGKQYGISNLINTSGFENLDLSKSIRKKMHTNDYERLINEQIPNYFERRGKSINFNDGGATIDYFSNLEQYFGNYLNSGKKDLAEKEYYLAWLDKFYEWWAVNKEGLLKKDAFEILSSGSRVLVTVIENLKRSVLNTIPINYLREEERTQLMKIFQELSDANNDIAIRLIPTIQRLKANDSLNLDSILNRIGQANNSAIKINGVKSFFEYVVLIKRREISGNQTEKIFEELKALVKYSEGELLEASIETLANIIDFNPKLINESNRIFLIGYLNNYLITLENDSELEIKHNLKLLSLMARLAAMLIKYGSIKSGGELERWRRFISNHSLPEVKEAMLNFDDQKLPKESE